MYRAVCLWQARFHRYHFISIVQDFKSVFTESNGNEKSEKECMKILRTTGTLICGKVITKNEHGIYQGIIFTQRGKSPATQVRNGGTAVQKTSLIMIRAKYFVKSKTWPTILKETTLNRTQ